jgi:hypothetical protein
VAISKKQTQKNRSMNIRALKQSRFLTKEDCGQGILVTIRGDVTMENVAADGAPIEEKACLHFEEVEKPLVLNSTNGQIIANITGSQETENWNGKKIVLYHDPNISFAGKIVGGVRARAARNAAAAKPAPIPVESDDVPF